MPAIESDELVACSRPRRRRFVLWSLLALVLVAATVAGWLWVSSHSIGAELERIHRAGEPISLEELAPPSPPEGEEDAGRYYAAAVRAINSEAEDRDEPGARAVWDAVRSGSLQSLTPEQVQALRGLLERNAEALSRLDRGAAVEECRLVVNILPGAPLSIDEHAGTLMRLARLFHRCGMDIAWGGVDRDGEWRGRGRRALPPPHGRPRGGQEPDSWRYPLGRGSDGGRIRQASRCSRS